MTLPLGNETVDLFDVDFFVVTGASVTIYVIGKAIPTVLTGVQAQAFCDTLSWRSQCPLEREKCTYG